MKKNIFLQSQLLKTDTYIYYLLLLTILIVPMVLHFSSVKFESPIIVDDTVLGSGIKVNVFTYAKFIWLEIISIVILLFLIYRNSVQSFVYKPNFLYISLAISLIGLVLSLSFAPYKTLSLVGDYMRNEGTLTYFSYLLLFFSAVSIQIETNKYKLIGYFLYPYIVINTTFVLLYFYGFNILNSSFMKGLLGLADNIKITDASRLTSTLDHVNYVSGVSSILVGLFLTWSIFDTNWKRATINLVMSLLSVTILFASISRSGFITFVFVMILLAIFIFKSTHVWRSVATYIIFMFCSIVIHRLLLSTNSKVWDESIGVFLARENSSPKILLIILGLVGIILFSIFLKFIWIKASSPSRNILKWSGITTLIVGVLLSSLLLLPKLWEVSIEKMAPSENVVQQTLGTENTYTEEQAKYLPDLPEKGVGAGSGRAYIWKRAFELIKERPVFGYGMDTFAYHFPQDDPEKYANLEDYSVIVDKPHNIYIGLAFGGGLITLFGFLGIICFGLYRGFKWIITSSKLSENSITVALFVSAIAYFIQGLFNDSVIGVSTMMWIVFGLFISSVLKLEKNN